MIDLPKYLLYLCVLVVLCIVSCVFGVGEILRADPALAYNGSRGNAAFPPEFIRRAKINSYIKYGIVFMIRNKKRYLLTVLSIMGCITLSAASLEYYSAFYESVPRVFEKRYTYDYVVGITGGEKSLSAITALDGVEKAEGVISFTDTVRFGDEQRSVKVLALRPDAELIVPYTADYQKLTASDGVILDEWIAEEIGADIGDTVTIGGKPLVVTGLNRGLSDLTQYISPENAVISMVARIAMTAITITSSMSVNARLFLRECLIFSSRID